MKSPRLAFALSLACSAASAAEPVTFAGSLRENGGVRLSFEETIDPGQKRTMTLSSGQVIEMTLSDEGIAQVRLLDASGGVLHESPVAAIATGTMSFMYTRCRDKSFTYSNPAEAGEPRCK